jgi:hypothetical protein
MDFAHGRDSLSVGVQVPIVDSCHAHTVWTVERWGAYDVAFHTRRLGREPKANDFKAIGVEPYRVTQVVGNLITNAGWTRLMNLLTNQGATQALTATAVRIGVGNSNTAEAYTDTDLIASAGSTNRWFQPVSGVGTLGTRTLAFSASFASADGNFAWNEFGLDVGTPTVTASAVVSALLFNRKAGIAQGTKVLGQVWSTTATITFT